MNSEMMTSIMNFTGGLLAFLAVLFAILNSRLQKARNKKARERIVENLIWLAIAIMSCIGFIFTIALNMNTVSLCFYWAGFILMSYNYLRNTGPSTRIETFILVMITAIVFGMTYNNLIGRILAVLEKISN